ncbi:MAG: hypothetical protein ACRDPC_12945, partial [Solirubrobacteraceae bacterium]
PKPEPPQPKPEPPQPKPEPPRPKPEPSWLDEEPAWPEPEPPQPKPEPSWLEDEPAWPEPAPPEAVEEEFELPWRRAKRPWPEAADLWSCQIAWKPGYVKSSFRAMAAPPGAPKRRPIAESSPIRWTLMSDPDPEMPEVVAAVRDLIAALEAGGWERTEPGDDWFEQRFLWLREDAPGRIGA